MLVCLQSNVSKNHGITNYMTENIKCLKKRVRQAAINNILILKLQLCLHEIKYLPPKGIAIQLTEP